LIGVAVRAVLGQIFLVASNVFLVVLNILLRSRGRVRALGIHVSGQQAGKRESNRTSSNEFFRIHRFLS